MTALLAGIALGLVGSGHCAGMCGPLVLTVGRRLGAPSRAAEWRHVLLYHAGRVTAYMSLAIPVGMLGQSLAVHGLGRVLAVSAGGLLLLVALGSAGIGLRGTPGARFSTALVSASVPVRRWARTRPTLGPLAAGAVNGLLPCGLVYAAVAAAAATGSARDAVLVMAGFGVGTMPVLVALTMSARAVPPSVRLRLRRLAPAVLAVTAALLIARGLAPAHDPVHAAPAPAHHRGGQISIFDRG